MSFGLNLPQAERQQPVAQQQQQIQSKKLGEFGRLLREPFAQSGV
jgi:hypothetical protein